MGRVIRSQLPGAAFHITTRIQGKEALFREDIRDRIVNIIDEGIAASGASLIGFAVMPNHLHILVKQGTRSLGWVLQPVLRRIALLVQRRFDREGHVFERRYRSHACADAYHLRCAIVYTHLNPVRAGLCAEVSEFRWTSHLGYRAGSCGTMHARYEDVYPLFAITGAEARDQLRANYQSYLDYRVAKDGATDGLLPSVVEPQFPAGDQYFREHFTCIVPGIQQRPAKDLRDAARDTLAQIASDVELETLRQPYGSRANVISRNWLIAGLVQSNYPGVAIAQFFRISQPTVSAIAANVRFGGFHRI